METKRYKKSNGKWVEVEVKEASLKLSDYMKKPIGKKISNLSGKKVQSEDEVIYDCVEHLSSRGWECTTLFTGGIPVGGGRYAPNPAKGIPDSFNTKGSKCAWIEYKKSSGGILSAEQETWHRRLRICNHIIFVVNSLESLKEQMNEAFGEDY